VAIVFSYLAWSGREPPPQNANMQVTIVPFASFGDYHLAWCGDHRYNACVPYPPRKLAQPRIVSLSPTVITHGVRGEVLNWNWEIMTRRHIPCRLCQQSALMSFETDRNSDLSTIVTTPVPMPPQVGGTWYIRVNVFSPDHQLWIWSCSHVLRYLPDRVKASVLPERGCPRATP
jgi:hypothetical protein